MDNIIVKITDKDLGLDEKKLNKPTIRYGARGIVINDKGEIAVFHKRIKNEYKLPGGGIENNENAIDSFRREVMEETGCDISDIKELGIAIEEKGITNFRQVSHVFSAHVTRNTRNLHLTKKERDEGGEVLWLLPDAAYEKVLNCINNLVGSIYDDKYKSIFMVKRDAMILRYYLNKKNKNEANKQ